MKTLKEIQVEGSTYELSLAKLLGSPIADIRGYLTKEFGDPCFQMTSVVLEDGRKFYAEGEHDLPYLTDGTGESKFNPEELDALYEEANKSP